MCIFLLIVSGLGAMAFALLCLIYSRDAAEPFYGDIVLLHIFLFFTLKLMVELNYVMLPHGRTLSGGFGIVLAAMLVFNSVTAVLIAMLSPVLIGILQRDHPKEPVFFRTSRYTLVYSLCGIAMHIAARFLPGTADGLEMILLGGVVTVVYLAANLPLSSIYATMLGDLEDRSKLWVKEELRQQAGRRYEITGTIFLYPIAVTMAYSYDELGVPFLPVILAVLCIFTVRYIGQMQSHKRLSQQINRDHLLGVLNRRGMIARLAEEINMARRFKKPLSVVLVDLDGFKEINDTHGHLTGDRVLKQVTEDIESSVRSADSIARFGGDELTIIMPETPAEGALVIASRIREKIGRREFNGNDGNNFQVTLSMGISSLPMEVEAVHQETPSTLIGRADEALYRAKADGRNCVRSELDRVPQQ